MFAKIQRIHFVGIGGIGMSGIAEVLLNLGYKISGSDLRTSGVTQRLASLGATIHDDHAASNIAAVDVVVTSSAVSIDNAEVAEARRLHIPVIPRAEMLAELMRLKYGIAIAGMHGKTTTTSMVAAVLAAGGLDPTVVVGGRVDALGSNARLGKSQYLVAEADESDRSFLKLSPILSVVTNIDREHMDNYADMIDVLSCFRDFVNKVPFYGAAILCLDDPNVQAIIPFVKRRRVTYGFTAQADISAHDVRYDDQFGSVFNVMEGDQMLGEMKLPVPGKHNVYNALAAIAVGLELDIPFDKIREGMSKFKNANRRFQFKGEAQGVTIVDDYGHHPTEITATLAAAKNGSGGKRTVVIFQPHRYTRTADLMEDFARSFNNADVLFVCDIYAASEDPIEGVTAEVLTEKIRQFGHKNAHYIGDIETAAEKVREYLKDDDLLITLGAGSVSKLSDQMLEILSQ